MTSCSQFVHVIELGWGAPLWSIFGKHARGRYAPIYVSLVVLLKMLLKLSSKHESKKISTVEPKTVHFVQWIEKNYSDRLENQNSPFIPEQFSML